MSSKRTMALAGEKEPSAAAQRMLDNRNNQVGERKSSEHDRIEPPMDSVDIDFASAADKRAVRKGRIIARAARQFREDDPYVSARYHNPHTLSRNLRNMDVNPARLRRMRNLPPFASPAEFYAQKDAGVSVKPGKGNVMRSIRESQILRNRQKRLAKAMGRKRLAYERRGATRQAVRQMDAVAAASRHYGPVPEGRRMGIANRLIRDAGIEEARGVGAPAEVSDLTKTGLGAPSIRRGTYKSRSSRRLKKPREGGRRRRNKRKTRRRRRNKRKTRRRRRNKKKTTRKRR